MIELNSVNYLH